MEAVYCCCCCCCCCCFAVASCFYDQKRKEKPSQQHESKGPRSCPRRVRFFRLVERFTIGSGNESCRKSTFQTFIVLFLFCVTPTEVVGVLPEPPKSKLKTAFAILRCCGRSSTRISSSTAELLTCLYSVQANYIIRTATTMDHTYLRYECADQFGLVVAAPSSRAPPSNSILGFLDWR